MESDAEQGCPESVDSIPVAVPQSEHVEECWGEMDPWKSSGFMTAGDKENPHDSPQEKKKQLKKQSPLTAADVEEPFKDAVKSVGTVAVESGATSFNEGRGGNCKPVSPISLHAVP